MGVLLRGTKREDVERGQVLAKKGTITPTRDLKQRYTYYPKKRVVVIHHFSMDIAHSFSFRTTDVTGSVDLPSGVEMVMPGDNFKVTVIV